MSISTEKKRQSRDRLLSSCNYTFLASASDFSTTGFRASDCTSLWWWWHTTVAYLTLPNTLKWFVWSFSDTCEVWKSLPARKKVLHDKNCESELLDTEFDVVSHIFYLISLSFAPVCRMFGLVFHNLCFPSHIYAVVTLLYISMSYFWSLSISFEVLLNIS